MLGALLLLLAPIAADGCRYLEEDGRLCPARLPAQRWLRADRVGQGRRWSSDDPPCRRFRPTRRDVRRLLAHAERTDAQTVHYRLAASPCFAAGRIRFADGRLGRYELTQAALMYIAIGRAPRIVLYCPDCRFAGLGR